jgi:hypothetical protein
MDGLAAVAVARVRLDRPTPPDSTTSQQEFPAVTVKPGTVRHTPEAEVLVVTQTRTTARPTVVLVVLAAAVQEVP